MNTNSFLWTKTHKDVFKACKCVLSEFEQNVEVCVCVVSVVVVVVVNR